MFPMDHLRHTNIKFTELSVFVLGGANPDHMGDHILVDHPLPKVALHHTYELR